MTLEVRLSFRAQSLDNINNDIIVKDGKTLEISEDKARQDVVSKIYRVVSTKTKVVSAQNITIYRRESDFVIEAIPAELDSRKRTAPIVIYGKLPEEWSEYWGSHVRSQIEDFVKSINRTLEDKTLDTINVGLKKAFNRKQRKENFKDWLIKLGIAVIIPLLLGWLLQMQVPNFLSSKDSSTPTKPPSTSTPNQTNQSPANATIIYVNPTTGTDSAGAGNKVASTPTKPSSTSTSTQTNQSPAKATIIYVNPTTGADSAGAGNTEATPYKTITYALSQAQSGTVIQLAPGKYSSETKERFPLTLKQGVTLRGDESHKGKNIIITGGGNSQTFARQSVSVRAEKDSTIAGVTITNPSGTALWIESTNPIVRNNTFTNSKRDGIFVTGTAAPTIEANVFTKNSGNGISVAKAAQGSARLVLRNNVFQNNREDGLVVTVTSQAHDQPQTTQTITPKDIQKLIMPIACLIGINNALILVLLKLRLASLLSWQNRKKN